MNPSQAAMARALLDEVYADHYCDDEHCGRVLSVDDFLDYLAICGFRLAQDTRGDVPSEYFKRLGPER